MEDTLRSRMRRAWTSVWQAVERLTRQEQVVLVLGSPGVESQSFLSAWAAAHHNTRVEMHASDGLQAIEWVIVSGGKSLRLLGTDHGRAGWPLPRVLDAALHWLDDSARLVLLVDATAFARPSRTDKKHLCWAWRRAFPQLPEALVRDIIVIQSGSNLQSLACTARSLPTRPSPMVAGGVAPKAGAARGRSGAAATTT